MTKKVVALLVAVSLVIGFGAGLAVGNSDESKSEIAYKPGVGA